VDECKPLRREQHLALCLSERVAIHGPRAARPSGPTRQGGACYPNHTPIEPTFKAPGTKGLKLKHDELLLSFAFNFNLGRYD